MGFSDADFQKPIACRRCIARGAVRSAVRGAAYLLPDVKPTHASDLGERPQRIVKALRPIPADWLPGVSHDQARHYCNEAMRILRLSGIMHPRDFEISDTARQLWRRDNNQKASSW